MKRLLSVMIVLLFGGIMIFAAEGTDPTGSWSNTLGTALTSGSATMNVTFNLAGSESGEEPNNEQIKIGFASVAVDDITATVTPVKEVALQTSDGVGVLSADTYIFWQISSANPMTITLTWPDAMEGTTEGNTLEWDVTTTLPDSSSVDDGTAVTEEASGTTGAVVLDRSSDKLSNFRFGTVGSQKLTIETASLDNAAIDTYTGTLTLTVSAE